jgi:hypothetical protein
MYGVTLIKIVFLLLAFYVSWPIWVKFNKNGLNLMFSGYREFHENCWYETRKLLRSVSNVFLVLFSLDNIPVKPLYECWKSAREKLYFSYGRK